MEGQRGSNRKEGKNNENLCPAAVKTALQAPEETVPSQRRETHSELRADLAGAHVFLVNRRSY